MSSETSGIDWSKAHRENGKPRDMSIEPGQKNTPGAGAEMRYGSTPGNLGNLRATDAGLDAVVSSPPYEHDTDVHGDTRPDDNRPGGRNFTERNYGGHPDNIASLRATDAGFSAAVSSPPYADGAQHTGGDDPKPEHIEGGELRHVDYGRSAGQLAAMRADGFDGAVSSLPYEASMSSDTSGIDWSKMHREDGKPRDMSIEPGQRNRPGAGASMRYGLSNGQLGSSSGDDFWSAARLIIEQTYVVLRPGAHAVWVLKRFVRDGAIVEFPQQWAKLCETLGFRIIHWHRAMLIEDHGTQFAIDGNHKRHIKKRASFFRRLAEAKGSPAIDWEDVVCMEKPHE